MIAAILIFIVVFILGITVVGFLVVNSIAILLALFGIIVPAFSFIHYTAVGFLLVYIRGYFNTKNSISNTMREYVNKINNKRKEESND